MDCNTGSIFLAWLTKHSRKRKHLPSKFIVYTIKQMDYEFDTAKDESNLDKHGLLLADVEGFEWETAVVHEDERKQYAERRAPL